MTTESDNIQEGCHNRPPNKGIWLSVVRLFSIMVSFLISVLTSIQGTISSGDGRSEIDTTDEPTIEEPREEETPQILTVDSRIEIALPDMELIDSESFNSELYVLDGRRKVVYKVSDATREAIIAYAMPWTEHPTILTTLSGNLIVVDSTSDGQRTYNISEEVRLAPEAHWIRFDAPDQRGNN